ncbi:hypothetical protein [Cellulomonas sp. Leaf334]|uniref:hypothetical protein n=1 Tax=Cellulomonas sp. Leaf334 TaxID=1736339 RepID=UPI000700F55D|nr:hypothetical protein [Cellulomonas sp. Leaf334]KQR08615.1 hypothetical protein ASF78_20485 [Cellulomonas sp. Leaf334]
MTAEPPTAGPLDAFRAVWDHVLTLPPAARAMFALGCAERQVRAADRHAELLSALEAGWTVARGGSVDLAAVRAELDARDDLDDDDVAATYFALGSAVGDPQDCRAAASRAMDAAFARAEDDEDATGFRPLADDATGAPVTAELAWQQAAAARLATDGPTEAVMAWLRR